MSLCPAAVRMLLPESGEQPKITPTQVIFHSLAAPWTIRRTYEHWQSVNLESHFGVDYSGAVGQYVDTGTRADANYRANRRADGTGAISVETSSNRTHTDPWTDSQVRALIALGVWAHQEHGVPLRICRTQDDPGFGVHRMFPEWSTGGTACPGAARFRQFKDDVFPGIVRALREDEDMPTPQEIAGAVWEHGLASKYRQDKDGKPQIIPARALQVAEDGHYDKVMAELVALKAQVKVLTERGVIQTAVLQAAGEAGARAVLAALVASAKKG